jgi:UDP-GlcNAc:undecaprenyl-phosphate GlcNAc-1-phosphate transferase
MNIVYKPNERHKTHVVPIPYLGGIGIIIGVVGTTYTAIYFANGSLNRYFLASTLLVPAFLLAILGLIDDMRKLNPWPRFIAQTCAGIATAAILISTKTIGSPTGSALLDAFVTVLWIVGITNAINFFDNVDGGASGTVAITSIAIFLLANQSGQQLIASLSIVLSGATAAFLAWNKPPARIYMGDAGALFLGLLIASLTIRLDTNPINRLASFAVPILLLAIPIIDTSVAVISRIKRRISPFQGGRDHLSHRLMRKGLSKRQSIIILWLLTSYFAALSVVISNVSFQTEGLVLAISAASLISLFIYFIRQSDS